MDKKSTILITGNEGMVGKALIKLLKSEGFTKLLLPKFKELDLRNQKEVQDYFKKNKIDHVFHLAAKVGGIKANISAPAEFLYDNLIIACNVMNAAKEHNVKKLLYLGSSCIYPKECPQPMKEEHLLSGKLEPTNEGYALSKIAGLKLCEYYNKQYGTNFICLMPCNLYGLNDHFDLENSHVISALILKFYNAKSEELPFVEIWGTGNARREFLFVEDVADAMVYFINKYDVKDLPPFVNVGYGEDITVKELAFMIKDIVNYKGDLRFDSTKPEGMMKKLLDSNKAHKLGWKAKTSLKEGIRKTYEWFLDGNKG